MFNVYSLCYMCRKCAKLEPTISHSKNSIGKHSKRLQNRQPNNMYMKMPGFSVQLLFGDSVTNSEFDFDCACFVRISNWHMIWCAYKYTIFHVDAHSNVSRKGDETEKEKKLNKTHVTPVSLTTTSENIAYIRFACWMVFVAYHHNITTAYTHSVERWTTLFSYRKFEHDEHCAVCVCVCTSSKNLEAWFRM